MSRKKSSDEGRKICIYMKQSQLEQLDAECDKLGVKRSKYIEQKLGLGDKIQNKSGDYGKGQKRGLQKK